MHRPPCARSHRRWRTRSRSARRPPWPWPLKDRPAPLNSARRSSRGSGVNRSWPRLRHYHAPRHGSGNRRYNFLNRRGGCGCFNHTLSLDLNHRRSFDDCRSSRNLNRRGRCRRHWSRHRRCRFCHRRGGSRNRRRNHRSRNHWRCSRCLHRGRMRRCRRNRHHGRTRNHWAHRWSARNCRCRRRSHHNRRARPRLRHNSPRRHNRRCRGPGRHRSAHRRCRPGRRGAHHGWPRNHCRGPWRRAARLLLRLPPLQDQPHRIAGLGNVGEVERRLRFRRCPRRRSAGSPAIQ
jgi:hypothetical protein